MSRSHIAQDLRRVMAGLLKVANTSAINQQSRCETVMKNSSVVKAAQDAPEVLRKVFSTDPGNLADRASMVPVGIKQFLELAPKYIRPSTTGDQQETSGFSEEIVTIREEDLEEIYLKSLGVEVMQQNEDGKRYMEDLEREDIRLSNSSSAPLHSESLDPDVAQRIAALDRAEVVPGPATRSSPSQAPPLQYTQIPSEKQKLKFAKPLSTKKPVSQLSESSKQRKVPASRLGRVVSFGGLAVGLGIGTITEMTKRSLGLGHEKKGDSLLESSPFLTEANAERIVDTLCRVRGAALKIGQILSIQDNSMINPQLQKVFERVRHAADFMPLWQMERMMVQEFGVDWKSKLQEFDEKPFAAASIGQVHLGKLHDGRPVAIKIQYPGVAQGIESDIDNLMSILNVWSILPEGIFIDKVVEVAKRELSWEVDYIREAVCAKRFRTLLENNPDYYVPEVVDELSTKQIYTTELIEGLSVDRCEHLDQDTRNRICYLMLDLFFRELFEFQFMQTDPNWSNFLYNVETRQIGLLDFGASREYRNGFVDNYMRILKGAAANDKETVIKASRDIGFLTGYESKAMENAHVETVMILGEALRIGDEKYDFGSQDLTLKIQRLVPVMVKERLCPPPEEIYSLHRKLSGVFLLCSRLKAKVQCKPIFDRVCANYVIGRPDKK
ncbi:AarF domain-containing protein kinase 4 [Orchesella cincta]|uniref:AarF domain-containing protein kinase 4 n=1 Tax=Orchesella cincta TaxID=48709 RepID=A0A1D2N379_ORCCI|nr:AarF domain-containing protein kinase 4 [Orchesella cincta]